MNEIAQPTHNPFRFRGDGYWDDETGFVYLRNRYMDPSLGRFITEDPYWNIGNMRDCIWSVMQSTNLYAFVANNPIMFVDPWGLRLIVDGSYDDARTVLDNLNEMSHDYLYLTHTPVPGNDNLWTVGYQRRNGHAWYGTNLVRRVIDMEDEIFVELTGGRSFFRAGNNIGRLFFNPNDTYMLVENHAGYISNQSTRAFIVLAHELIHADRWARRVMFSQSDMYPNWVRVRMNGVETPVPIVLSEQREELAVIGIRGQHVPGRDITENMIRQEHGFTLRRSHWNWSLIQTEFPHLF